MPATRFVRVMFVTLVLLAPAAAWAQFGSAIQGTVTDVQQALVPEATVRVTNMTTGVTREAVTSADGVYRVTSLGPGAYRVEVEKEGFDKAQRDSVRLGISETIAEAHHATEAREVASRFPCTSIHGYGAR
jgi:uncharacterized membrane protein